MKMEIKGTVGRQRIYMEVTTKNEERKENDEFFSKELAALQIIKGYLLDIKYETEKQKDKKETWLNKRASKSLEIIDKRMGIINEKIKEMLKIEEE